MEGDGSDEEGDAYGPTDSGGGRTGDSPGRGGPERLDPRTTERFRFAYAPPAIRCGRGAVEDLGAELAAAGFGRGLVVCGRTVGSTPAVMDPVREGLGDRLAGVFSETTPDKRLSTAADGLDALEASGADVVVAVGGGSSLDVAKVLGVLAARVAADGDREATLEAVGREFEATGTVAVPAEGVVPVVAVPTTLAGADLSQVAGITAAQSGGLVDEETDGGLSDPALMPAAVVVDPALLATTPEGVLAASAMNGFDKGIETLYARSATPITDGTAMRGLSLFREGLDAFGAGSREPWMFDALARGAILVQYGVSRPDGTTLSLIHAFGHGLSRTSDVQQGAAHAVLAPHVLEFLFDAVDGRRDLLAEALGVGDAPDAAAAIVEAVVDLRDALDLPARLRALDGPGPASFPAVAEVVLTDSFLANAPADLDLTAGDVEAVLEAAW
jgi:alcohol dehydrogenase